MKTSIVILNWNGADMMRRFLPSVLEYSAGAEVVVADNGSTDESLQMLEHDFPRVHIIKMERNTALPRATTRRCGRCRPMCMYCSTAM